MFCSSVIAATPLSAFRYNLYALYPNDSQATKCTKHKKDGGLTFGESYAIRVYRNADKGVAAMIKVEAKPIGFFHTPESMEELQNWIESANDPIVTTAAMMMWNLLTSQYDMVAKK